MSVAMTLKQLISLHDEDRGRIKLPLFTGDKLELTVLSSKVTVEGTTFYLSSNLLDGSRISATFVPGIGEDVMPCLILRDILRFGRSDLSMVVFRHRYELLDILLASFPDEYGFKAFSCRCVAPHVFLAKPVTLAMAAKCQDHRVVGITSICASKLDHVIDVLLTSAEEVDVDGIKRWPPVPDESKRLKGYEYMIRSMVRKMCGKWKDVYKTNHQPGALPFSAEDLLQQGFMEALVAIRKYNANHPAKAKEATFVYQHLWNRFGHIAHKYSKRSRGYGVHIIRDFVDEEGNVVSPYDLGPESRRHGYLGNTDPDLGRGGE